MLNEVQCVLTFKEKRVGGVKLFLERHPLVSNTTKVEYFTTPGYHHMRFFMRWKPLATKDCTEKKGFPKMDYVKLCWNDPDLLSYGWWRRDGNHTEIHVYDEAEMGDDDQPAGAYVEFLVAEHL